MPKYHVQQFYETEDEFYPLGDIHTLDLTEEEETKLRKQDGGPEVWLDGRGGYFGLASEEPVEN